MTTDPAKAESLRWLEQTSIVVGSPIEDVTANAVAALEGAVAEGATAVAHLVVWLAQFARYGVELALASSQVEGSTAVDIVEAMRRVLADLPD